MNRLLIPVLSGLLAVTITSPAAAWGRQGHALVAEVAQTRLNPQTQAQVDALLALEGHPDMAAIASWA
jgi:nuclease S1